MTMVFCNTETDSRINGLMNAAKALDFQAVNWIKSNKSAMDMADELKPNFLFFSINDYDQNIEAMLQTYKHINMVIFGSTLPKDLLVHNGQLLLCPVKSTEKQKSLFKKMEIDFLDLDFAADLAAINRGMGEPVDKYFVYSDMNIHEDTLNEMLKKDIIIAGPVPLRHIQYVGEISNKEHANFISSYKNLIFSREEMYNVLANGGHGETVFENSLLPMVDKKPPMDLDKAANLVLDKHTYFHRLKSLLNKFNIAPTTNIETLIRKITK